MRVIIAGGRDYKNYNFVKEQLDELWSKHLELKELTILNGMASGVDSLAYKWAKERNFTIEEYPAQWNRYGKAAGPMRNRQMAEKADVLIAFWDGHSPGTQNMIEEARAKKLKIKIIGY